MSKDDTTEKSKKATVTLLLAVLAALILGVAIDRLFLPPTEDQTNTNRQNKLSKLTSENMYKLANDIEVIGLQIKWSKLEKILSKMTADGWRVKNYMLVEGAPPQEYADEIRKTLKPYYSTEDGNEINVLFDIIIDSERIKAKVITGNPLNTLAYFLSLKESNHVLFRAGQSAESIEHEEVSETDLLQASAVSSNGVS